MRPRSMHLRKIPYLLWIFVFVTLLLSSPCVPARADIVLSSSRASSILLTWKSSRLSLGTHLSRKKLSQHADLQGRTSSVVMIAHRRVHRRFGVETPAAPIDPLFVQVGRLIDANPHFRSSARFQSYGRSPPLPPTDSRE